MLSKNSSYSIAIILALCCFIGATPRTDWLDGVVARDDHGFILAGPDLRDVCGWSLERPPHHLETSVPGVFVAGDVRAESAKRVAAAVDGRRGLRS